MKCEKCGKVYTTAIICKVCEYEVQQDIIGSMVYIFDNEPEKLLEFIKDKSNEKEIEKNQET